MTFRNDELLRLFFEGREAAGELRRPALILGARSLTDLQTATAAVLASASCTELEKTNVDCVAFLGLSAAVPMLHVFLNGKPDDVPLGATVASALKPLARNQRGTALPRLRIERLFRNTYVDVGFPRSWELVSKLPLYAGDRLSW